MDIIKKSLFILGNFKSKLFILTLIILSATILDLLSLGMMLPLLNLLVSDNYVSFIDRYEVLKILKNYSRQELLMLSCISLTVLFLLKSIFMIFLNIYKNFLVYNVTTEISNKLTKKYLYSNYKLFIYSNTSHLLRNIVADAVSFASKILNAVVFLIIDSVLLVVIIIFLFNYNFESTIIISISIIIIFFLFYLIFKKILIRWSSEKLNFDRLRYRHLNEIFSAIKEIKVFSSEKFFFDKFKRSNNSHFKIVAKEDVISSLPRIIIEFFSVLTLSLIVYLFLSSNKSIEELLIILGLFAIASFRVLPTLTRLIVITQSLKSSVASVDNLYNEIISKKYLINSNIKHYNITNVNNLKLEKINFRYNENKIIFKDLSFNFTSGNIYGILGDSGSGKTTLIDIISGLLIPDSGSFYINGNQLSGEELREAKLIGYVPQEVYLNDDTIKSNIVFSDNKINDLDLMNSLKTSQLEEFVRNLPKGIDTQVGEKGTQISGGQKQRIGIARALYHKFPIIILDEPTSSLDPETEKNFLNSLTNIKKNRIIIMVSHRKTTLEVCDKKLEVSNLILNDLIN